jgi:hypothetical protein
VSGAPFDPPVRGAAHGRVQRAIATLMVVVVVIGLLRLLWTAPEASEAGSPWFIGAAAFAFLAAYGFLMTSTTTLDATGIRQSGLLERKVAWSEIATARLGGFGFARLLRVRTRSGRRISFAGATPELEAAFARVVADYSPQRSIER